MYSVSLLLICAYEGTSSCIITGVCSYLKIIKDIAIQTTRLLYTLLYTENENLGIPTHLVLCLFISWYLQLFCYTQNFTE